MKILHVDVSCISQNITSHILNYKITSHHNDNKGAPQQKHWIKAGLEKTSQPK